MEILTKYAIGDKLWRIDNSKAVKFEVCYIGFDGTSVSYGESPYWMKEEQFCFPSKESLIESLFNEE